MRSHRSARRDQAYLVTEAHLSRSAEIGQRERRYLVMMGVRVVCFVITVVMFMNHAGWLTAIPAVGAIAIPYFAVVIANSRASAGVTGFRPYRPNLPERYVPPGEERRDGPPGAERDRSAADGTDR